MDANKLPARPSLEQYKKQAKDLIRAFKSGNPEAMRWIKRYHPRLPGRADTNDRNNLTDSEIRSAKLSLADAQFVIAREYGFARVCQSLNRLRDFGGAETGLHEKIRPPGDALAFKLSFDANGRIARGLSAAR